MTHARLALLLAFTLLQMACSLFEEPTVEVVAEDAANDASAADGGIDDTPDAQVVDAEEAGDGGAGDGGAGEDACQPPTCPEYAVCGSVEGCGMTVACGKGCGEGQRCTDFFCSQPISGSGLERLGAAVDVAGTRAVIGLPGQRGTGGGAVQLWTRSSDSTGWTSQGLLEPQVLERGQCGEALALDATRLLVGCPDERERGSILLFTEQGGELRSESMRDGPDGSRMGTAVALLPGAAVGAGETGVTQASFYIILTDANGFVVFDSVADTFQSDFGIGRSLAATRDHVLLGTPRNDQFGSVYSIEKQGEWGPGGTSRETFLEPNVQTNTASTGFGTAVAFVPTGEALVGWPEFVEGGQAVGRVSLHRVNANGMWQELWSVTGEPGSGFGSALDVNENLIAVGSPGWSGEGKRGRVTVFYAPTIMEAPDRLFRVTASDSAIGFGAEIGLGDGVLLVGAPDSADGAGYAEFVEFEIPSP